MKARAEKIGDNVHMDIIPVPTSVGGNNHILFTLDEKSDFVIGIPIPTKSTPQLIKAADVIVGMYHLYGRTFLILHLTMKSTYMRWKTQDFNLNYPS